MVALSLNLVTINLKDNYRLAMDAFFVIIQLETLFFQREIKKIRGELKGSRW